MTSEHAPLPRSYTLREASGILGVSVTALRRRVAAGQVRAERLERPQGSAWRVFLDAHASGDAPSVTVVEREPRHAPRERAPATGTAELVALVGEFSQKLAESAAVAAMWQERARVLGEQLALMPPESPIASNLTPAATALMSRPFLKKLVTYGAVTLLALVAVVVLLVVPRW